MNEKISDFVITTLTNFETISKNPELLLSFHTKQIDEIKAYLKQTYDFIKTEEVISSKCKALPKLFIEDFDCEQIWQQIELQNDSVLTKSLINTSRLIVTKDNLTFSAINGQESAFDRTDDDSDMNETISLNSDSERISSNENDSSQSDNEKIIANENSEEDNLSSESENETGSVSSKTKKVFKNSSVVDDNFFKLDELENFLNIEDQKFEKSSEQTKSLSRDDEEEDDEESVDLFEVNDEDLEDEEDGTMMNPRFKDFFRAPNEQNSLKQNKHLNLEELDEERSEELKSTYEIRKERLGKKIEKFEGKALAEKPWQLKGEIRAENRPQNSLLEEFVEFDLTTRPAPVITEQTTLLLEDVIRQRIKDKTWDSVQRKEKPTEAPTEYKKKLLLDQEKSKESLAQIYEKEFLKQKEALDPDAADKEEEEPKQHQEIRKTLSELFTKLDALSNFHFTPKPVAPELKIISNIPAINMEEVAPVAVSDGALLAPEEVKRKLKGDEIGKTERTNTDKKRERRRKKSKQKYHAQEKLKKDLAKSEKPGALTQKMSKSKTSKMVENITKERNINKMDESKIKIKSSTAFFTQLQDEVKKTVKRKLSQNSQQNKFGGKVDAKKIKL